MNRDIARLSQWEGTGAFSSSYDFYLPSWSVGGGSAHCGAEPITTTFKKSGFFTSSFFPEKPARVPSRLIKISKQFSARGCIVSSLGNPVEDRSIPLTKKGLSHAIYWLCVLAFRICSSLLVSKVFWRSLLFYQAYEIDIFLFNSFWAREVRQTHSKIGHLFIEYSCTLYRFSMFEYVNKFSLISLFVTSTRTPMTKAKLLHSICIWWTHAT